MADNNSNPSSMGDLFLQRRRQAAAAAASQTTLTSLGSTDYRAADNNNNNNSANNASASSNRKKSFLEIQQEQEQLQREQQKQQKQNQQPPRSSSQAGGGGHYQQQSSSYHRSSGSTASSHQQRSLYNPNASNSSNSSNRREQREQRERDRGRSSSRGLASSNLPIEQGVIHTLLDKFGFILCADRNIELFFHYSEYKSGHSDTLQIGDEVEFRVSEEQKTNKLAALDVRQLPKGTIYWEYEEEEGKVFDGVVELSCSSSSMREDGGGGDRGGRRGGGGGKKGGGDGIIRLKKKDDDDEQQQQPMIDIYYTPSDYKPNNKKQTGAHSSSSRLERKDVIQFSLVTERRTGKKYARNITLIQSERERQRLEREAKLMENATLERGKVVSTKGDFGFLRSVSRVEQVYYHVSHVVELTTDDGNDDVDNNMPSLTEGQEVEFYVINEQGGGGGRGGKKGGGKSLSARKIKLLPDGTVKFEHELAQGVTGYVLECPVPEASADPFFGGPPKKSGGGSSTTVAAMGKIRLDTPIIDTEGKEVIEVVLHPDMYPGGTFALSRTGGEVGIWIRPGDTLLFDIIQTIVDGAYRAVPTRHSQCLSLRSEDTTAANDKALIRLVQPSLCGRAEGVIRSIRDNYGFIHSAERNVDVYFPLFEVLPNEIHEDLVNNNPEVYSGSDPVQNKGGRIHVEVGMEVSFDLSLQILTNAGSGGRGGGGGRSRQNNSAAHEKESLRGRRVQILPKGTVQEKILVASQVKATVSKDDPKQPFVGTIELEESLTVQSASLRYPLTSKLLDAISAGKYCDEITFHDVLSEKDLQVVTSMVKNRDDLEWLYVPVSGEDADDPHNRKLRIVRKVKSNDAVESTEMAEEDVAAAAAEIEGGEGGSANVESSSGDAAAAIESAEKPNLDKKKGGKREKMVKTIRYDKYSFPDMSEGPLGVGDVVTCDIVLSRRTGALIVENIAVVERKDRSATISNGEDDKTSIRKELKGFVTEVVPSRQFGFITAVDEEGSKTGDHVFFHFKSVGSDDDAKKAPRADAIRKGDEVKFDAGPGKNGKLSATNISILPRGTLKTAAKVVDKATTCTGYILMEPSHTSLANTPSHITYNSNGPTTEGAGRWDNVKDARSGDKKSGSSVKEEGTILLLSDPSHLFSPKPSNANGAVTQTTDAENEGENVAPADETKQDDGDRNEADDEAANSDTALGVHVRYKTSSIAYRNPAGGPSLGGPKRGDLVTFSKTRGANLVKDIRVEKAGAATSLGGTLEDINLEADTAVFVSSVDEQRYEIKLSEVVSCDKSLLQDKEKVDGILHEGRIYGVCRTKDIHLASSFSRDRSGSSGGLKERPRLNLTVKKELKGMGGQIMAQSRMAKGPDGTNGFAKGWTTRLSVFVKEFVPSIESIEASGFESNNEMQVEEEMDAEVQA
jgi:cold shock CspA family protein